MRFNRTTRNRSTATIRATLFALALWLTTAATLAASSASSDASTSPATPVAPRSASDPKQGGERHALLVKLETSTALASLPLVSAGARHTPRTLGRAPLTPPGPLGRVAAESGAKVRLLGPSSPVEWQVWTFPSATAARAARVRIAETSGVLAVERPGRRSVGQVVPNDPQFASFQWNLHNTGQTAGGQVGLPGADIGAPTFWTRTVGSEKVVVAIIDTGIDLAHPELVNRLWVNSGETPDNNIDDDGNGYIDDYHGWSTWDNSGDVSDVHGHGTRVAGVIGAQGDNGIGIAGVAWDVRLMVLRGFGPTGTAEDDELIAAIDYALENGAHIINASWSGPDHSQALDEALERTLEAGVLFVAAAGNEHKRMDLHPMYPAATRLPNVLSVAATDNTDRLPYFTNRGGSRIDVFAPGVAVPTTGRDSTYASGDGTSFAAPHVAGAAALLLSQYEDPGEADPAVVARRLRAAVSPTLAATEQSVSQGRLWLPALLEDDTTPPAPVDDLEVLHTATNGATFRWTAPGDDNREGTARYYDVRYATEPIDETNFHRATLPEHLPAPEEAGTSQTWHLVGLNPNTEYHLAIRAIDKAGNTGALGPPVSFRTLGVAVTALASNFHPEHSDGWEAEPPWSLVAFPEGEGGVVAFSTENDVVPPVGESSLTSPPFSLTGMKRPVLTFKARRLFDEDYIAAPSGNARIVGSLDVLPAAEASWVTLASWHSSREPFFVESVDLGDYAGAESVRIRFRLRLSAPALDNSRWSIADVRVFEPLDWHPDPTTSLVEPVGEQWQFPNRPATYSESYLLNIGWTTQSQRRPRIAYVTAYAAREIPLAAAVGAKAAYTPRFQTDGAYRVSVSWPRTANATGLHYRVRHAQGETVVPLDQNGTTNGERWVALGVYPFTRGRSLESGTVVLEVGGNPKPVIGTIGSPVMADSVRFDFVEPLEFLEARTHWHLYR